jgi:SAM-dependent methyltransferase
MPRHTDYQYLLGDSRTESARLRAQARLWDPTAHALFARVGVRPGWRILEVGPGQGSLHLALRRLVRGPVDAVERSAVFCDRLRALCRRDGFGDGSIWQADLKNAALPPARYDMVFARWVFLFLPDPQAHIRSLVRALRPGGLLAIEDYYRDSLVMIPRPEEWTPFMAADHAFFASQGGDANIGARLPTLFRQAGLAVVEATPTIKTGRPGSAVWNWLSTYFLGILNRYSELGPLTRGEAQRLRRHWLAAARQPTSFLIAPTVVDVVGRKPRR